MEETKIVKLCMLVALLVLLLFTGLSHSSVVTTKGVDPGSVYGISL